MFVELPHRECFVVYTCEQNGVGGEVLIIFRKNDTYYFQELYSTNDEMLVEKYPPPPVRTNALSTLTGEGSTQ